MVATIRKKRLKSNTAAQLRGIRSVAVRRFFKKPLTGPLQAGPFNIHGSLSSRNCGITPGSFAHR